MFSRLEDLQARLDVHRHRQALQAAQVARMEERERIGLQLHDGVIQGIYGVQLQMDACMGEIQDERAVACLNTSRDELTVIIGRMRQYIFGLQPGLDNGVPLRRALTDLFQAAHANSNAETEFYAQDGTLDHLSDEEAGALFQAANEGVASALSRGATLVKATVTGAEGSLCLQMSDNGSAAGDSRLPHPGTERAAVKVTSRAGHNLLTVTLPLATTSTQA
jgi:signal transduction histidine kinase